MFIRIQGQNNYVSNVIQKENDDECYKPTVGERLKYCRERYELSVEDVAAYLRRSPQTVKAYEQNIRVIPYKDLVLLTMLYFHSMEYFCRPFLFEAMKEKTTAAMLLRYASYSERFYQANYYFPNEEEFEAIIALSGYSTCPIQSIKYLR